MAVGIPADILTETIVALGECIRGHDKNQEIFSTVMAPSEPPRPALILLLMSMVNDKQVNTNSTKKRQNTSPITRTKP